MMPISRPAVYRWLTAHLPRLARRWRDRIAARARRFPAILSVELTNHCNARCIMCPRQAMTRPRGLMTEDVFQRILAGAAGFRRHLRLFQPFMFGEALVHPKFCDWLQLARDRLPGVRIYVSTNAGLLDERRAAAILAAGVDKLNIDIDGVTAPVAESIRVGVDHGRVLANVRGFLDLRRRSRAKTKLRVSIIRLVANRHEIDAFVAHWRPVADQVQVVDCNTWLGAVSAATGAEAAATAPQPFDFPCFHPYEEMAIGWDGRVTLCCLDYDLRHVVGDVRRQSLLEIWCGSGYESARRAMETGAWARLPICGTCNAARFQRDRLWRHLWLSPSPRGSTTGATEPG